MTRFESMWFDAADEATGRFEYIGEHRRDVLRDNSEWGSSDNDLGLVRYSR